MISLHDPDICRSILESLPTGVCVVDMHKKIVFWSDGAERITGHLRHEVIGHSCVAETTLHCDQPGCEFCSEDCPIARAIKTSHSAEATGFLHHKSGHEVPVRIRAVPVHNPHGSIIGAVETFEELQHATNPDHREPKPKLPGCIDNVTGVASQLLMRSHLRHTLATFVELQVPFGVLYLCLEGLTQFRSGLGSEAASSLLRVVARSLESALWTTDFVGRWNDDEFVVILNGCREEALGTVKERIRRMLANDGIEWWGERRSVPISVGAAAALPDDSIESLIERAQKSVETAPALRARAAAACGGGSSGETPSEGTPGN
jgi:diguanylate cyclase (GGDEF)-like protein/PAS domain S-box-containing protein